MLLFPNDVEMRFGLFVTGMSSMGAASSCWTVISSGNVELSITMNVINTLLACGELIILAKPLAYVLYMPLFIFENTVTTPFWLFTLGKSIHNNESIAVPYDLFAQYICFSFIPLLVGILIQYIFKQSSEISKSILMGISFPFLVFIIVVSVMRGLHIFSMPFSDSWKVNAKKKRDKN